MRRILLAATAIVLATVGASAADMTADQKQLIDLETAWSKAIVDGNTTYIASIVADDWVAQDWTGKPTTKSQMLAGMKASNSKTTSMVNHDVTARVFGDVGVVQGADTQKGMDKGKDASGEYTWTDIFVKRGGKWMVVASQDSKVTSSK